MKNNSELTKNNYYAEGQGINHRECAGLKHKPSRASALTAITVAAAVG